MEQKNIRDPLIERRSYQGKFQDLWAELTLAQKFSASSLSKYGYELAFIRRSASGNIAIMLLDDNATTISCDGDINTTPEINIR